MPRTLCYPMASHTANCDNMLPPLLPSQTYGVNAAASWGYQWRQPYATGERGVSADPHVDRGWGAGCERQQHTFVSEGVQEPHPPYLYMLPPACCTGNKREVTTIYEVVSDAQGAAYLLPDYQFTCERLDCPLSATVCGDCWLTHDRRASWLQLPARLMKHTCPVV